MTISNYFFDGGNVSAAAVTQGTVVPANTKRKITAAIVTNSTGVAKTFTAHVIPAAGTAGATNMYISARTIAPGESYSCPELVGRGMNAGGFVQVLADVTGMTFKFEAFDITNG
jgi:hypothetical protein